MTLLAEQIYDEVLDLPIEERLGLIGKLVQSITPRSQTIQQAWGVEAERRYREFKEGLVVPIAGEEVFKTIKNRLNS